MASVHEATPHRCRANELVGLLTQVPILADTLRADTTDVLHGLAKHDMAEAVEHVVRGIGEIKVGLEQAFLARDTGRTGALGGSAFKVGAVQWRARRETLETSSEMSAAASTSPD